MALAPGPVIEGDPAGLILGEGPKSFPTGERTGIKKIFQMAGNLAGRQANIRQTAATYGFAPK